MSSPIGKFLQMAMSTGIMPKDALKEAAPVVGNYFTQWFKARKLATRLHGDEREMALMLVEADNQIFLVPCILKENEDGKDVINRQLTSQGVNISGMMEDLPLLDIITSAINDGDPIKTMQRLQDLLADAIDNNRLQEELPEAQEDHAPALEPVMIEDMLQDEEQEEDEEEEQP